MRKDLLHLYIPYASPGASWVVRREAAMLTAHLSQRLALQSALAYVASRGFTGGKGYVIRLQGEDGNWREADSEELSEHAMLAEAAEHGHVDPE